MNECEVCGEETEYDLCDGCMQDVVDFLREGDC